PLSAEREIRMRRRPFAIAAAGLVALAASCSDDPGGGAKPAAAGSGSTATRGDAGPPESADAVVQRYFQALHACDWNALSGLMHPQALVDFAHGVRPLIHKSRAKNLLSDLGVRSMEEVDVMSPTVLFEKLLALKMKLRPTLVGVYHSSTCT